VTYLITFTCYGCHLHGHEEGSVDRRHAVPGSRLMDADPDRVSVERQRMDQPQYCMDGPRREAVLCSIVARCSERNWNLLAAHVRTNHVHIVVEAEPRPERVMNDLKSYASRRLNQLGFDEADQKRWTRHGSTRWLWKPESVSTAIRYVVDEQGEPLSVYEA